MHEYMRRIRKAIKKGLLDDRPEVAHTNIKHDDWCAFFKGAECDCNPDIITDLNTRKVRVLEDGNIEEIYK